MSCLYQCLLGLECKDFTMIASDQTETKYIFIMKNVHSYLVQVMFPNDTDTRSFQLNEDNINIISRTEIDSNQSRTVILYYVDEDKILQLSNNLLMGINGEKGEVLQFSHYINNNFALYKIRNGYQLSAEAAVHFTRKTLADSIKNLTPYLLNLLVGSWDKEQGGQLYSMDFLGSCIHVPFAAQGFPGLLGTSILEYYYNRDLTEAQAYEVIQICVREIHERLFLNLPNFQVKVVSKDGICTLPVISPPRLNL